MSTSTAPIPIATLAASSKKLAEQPAAPAPVVRRVPAWKIPQMDTLLLASLRDVLGIAETDDLPEALYLVLAIRSALDQGFIQGNFGMADIANLIIQATVLPLIETASRITPGTFVSVKDLPSKARYVCPGPLGQDLINMDGRFFLRSPKDITNVEE